MAGHDVQYGKHRTRRSFSRIKEVLDLPNLIEIQTDSFKAFLDHGLKEVFEDVLPIQTLQTPWSWNLLDMKSRNQNTR